MIPQPNGGANVLQALRILLAAASSTVVMTGLVLLFVLPSGSSSTESLSPALATGIVGLFGIVTAAIGPRVPLALDWSSAEMLVETYRRRFFARLAFAESAALVGFVASILSSSFLPYLVGFCFAGTGFVRLLPTDTRIAAEQEQLSLAGCPHSLDAALRGTAH